MRHSDPPKWADWFIEKICPEKYLEEVQGDLHEAFYWRAEAKGLGYARRKFYMEAAKTIRLAQLNPSSLMKNLSYHLLKNYVKTAYRHLGRHKAYLMVNLLGLSLALALCIVAYINWKFDADFDLFHPHADKIFRVTTIKSNSLEIYGVCPAPIVEAAKMNHAGVIDAISLDSWNVNVNKGLDTYTEVIHFTESSFLDWFHFPLIEGAAEIDNPNRLLITERMAKKYFSEGNPIGQSLILFPGEPRKRELVISGILKNPPLNSSIQFNFITHFSNQVRSSGEAMLPNDWKLWRDAVFLVVENPENNASILEHLNQHIPSHQLALPNFESKAFFLEPFKGMAHHSTNFRWEELRSSLPSFSIWMNIVMAILLLLTACLNFANTTVALAGKRLKEIAVRKVMGGSQPQLIQQLMLENLMVCLLALALAIPLAVYVLSIYNQLYASLLDLKLSLLKNLPLIGFLLMAVLITTLIAGSYPAFYISSFNPNRIFKGTVKFGGSNLVSRILLGLQVAISLVALVAGFTFARNAHFQQTADLGFERNGIQAVEIEDASTFTKLKDEIQQNPKILAAAGVHSHIGDSCPRVDCSINGQKEEVEYMMVGEGYLELMDIQTTQGRSFKARMQMDYETSIIVNEKFVADFLPEVNPIGQKVILFDSLQYNIIGVVKNFMQDSFVDPLRPLVLKFSQPDQFEYLVVKTDPADMYEVQSYLATVWKNQFPMKPFVHYFQGDFLARTMQLTKNIKWFMIIIAMVTLFLTITGLFALISLNVLKRSKEIAIRRIFGATPGHISYILNKHYVWIISFGILLGCSFGAWFSTKLISKIYNIHAGFNTALLMLAAICTLVFVMLTIGIKIIQVLQRNPAEVLKTE